LQLEPNFSPTAMEASFPSMMQAVVGLSLEAAPFSLSIGASAQQQQATCSGQGLTAKDYRSEPGSKKGPHS